MGEVCTLVLFMLQGLTLHLIFVLTGIIAVMHLETVDKLQLRT